VKRIACTVSPCILLREAEYRAQKILNWRAYQSNSEPYNYERHVKRDQWEEYAEKYCDSYYHDVLSLGCLKREKKKP